MRITCNQLIIALGMTCMSYAHSGLSQQVLEHRVTISFRHISLEEALTRLEGEANVKFVYSRDMVNAGRMVSINTKGARLRQILGQLLTPLGIDYHIVNDRIVLNRAKERKTSFSGGSPVPQDLVTSMEAEYLSPKATVKGTVRDENGDGLPGVNVLVKGTQQGTVSDENGNYQLDIPDENAVLIFSFVGYLSQEIGPGSRTELDITLKVDQKALEEVVVTALGVTRERRQLGYSVQGVVGREFEKASDVNLINSLAGKVAGLKINTASELLINSQISLRGETPIIVVDGVSTKVGYWELNHNDIESVSVLKGAVAGALYGSEGRNGAIIVTTKRGNRNRTTIEVGSTTTIQPGLLTYPKTQTVFGSGNGGVYQYVNGTGAGLEGGGFTWGPKLDGRLLPQWNSPLDPNTGERVPIPWEDRTGGKGNLRKFLETGFVTVNNINLESGNDKGMFRASLSHSYQKGMVPNTHLNITGFNIGGQYNVRDWYSINTTLNYSRQYSPNYRTPGYGAQDYYYSLAFWLGSDIDLDDARNYWTEGRTNELQRFQQTGYYNNPYLIVYENRHTYDKNVVFGQISNNIRLIPDALDLLVRTGINSNALEQTETVPRSMLYNGVKSQGDFIINNSRFFRINTDFILTYKKAFSEFFELDALAGFATTYEINQAVTARTDGLSIPALYTLKNSMNPVINNNSKNEQRIDGLYANLNFKIWTPFYLSLTARNDWVSTLPVSNNNFLYPSASLAYVLSDMVRLPWWISLAKFRASWSQVNSGWAGSTYGHIPVYSIGSYSNLPRMEMGSVLLPSDLMPSGSRQTEFGGEVSLLKNRVRLDVTTYKRLDYDNIISMGVSQASGYGSILGNGREYERKGTEITLNARPVQGPFSWDLGINWSKSHRYLTELEDNKDRDGYIKLGTRIDQLYVIRWLRNQQNEVIYNATTGLPIRDTYQRFIGHSDPDFMFGIQNQLTYKNFNLSFSFEGQYGGLYSSILPRLKRAGTSADLDLQLREDAANGLKTYVGDGVVVTNGEVSYDFEGNIINDTRTFALNETKVSYEDWVKTYYNTGAGGNEEGYLDASYLKLREIILSYTLPASLLKKSAFSSATVSFIGSNIWLLTRKITRGDDPSWSNTGGNLKSPTPVNLGVNINLKF